MVFHSRNYVQLGVSFIGAEVPEPESFAWCVSPQQRGVQSQAQTKWKESRTEESFPGQRERRRKRNSLNKPSVKLKLSLAGLVRKITNRSW